MPAISKKRAHAKKAIAKRYKTKAKEIKPSSHLAEEFWNPLNEDTYITDWEIELSEPEDDKWVIGQPVQGWEAAEKNVHGNSKTSAGKYRQSKYYYKKKGERVEKERQRVQKSHKPILSYFKDTEVLLDSSATTTDSAVPTTGQRNNKELLATDIADFEKWMNTTAKSEGINGPWKVRANLVLSLLHLEQKRGDGFQAIRESMVLAQSIKKGSKFAQMLRRWARDWKLERKEVPKPQASKHSRRQTLFEDEEIINAVREYLNTNAWRSTVDGIIETVQDVLGSRTAASEMGVENALKDPRPEGKISRRTAHRWLAKLGWIYSRDKKGYVDGHEREDVIAYRNNVFLPRMSALEPYLIEFDENGEIPKTYPDGPQKILVTHDETTFSANDDKNYHWKKKGVEPLKSKSKGKGLMVSDFLSTADGRLRYMDPISGIENEACEIIRFGNGKNDDGYWNAEKMVRQVKEKAIPIFQKRFPGKKAVFAFDNSSGHAAFAADALVASRMNLNPGGKQPKMRATTFNGKSQSMVFLPHEAPTPELVGQAKGMRQVLLERGLWKEGLKKQCEKQKGEKGQQVVDECKNGYTCCALRILESQPDFSSEISLLQTTIEELGHECIFYPKFHCEFNFIEFFWAAVKRYTRENCNYSFAQLEQTVRAGLKSVPLTTIRRFSGRSKRWMSAYREGLSPGEKQFTEHVYRSHRREPVSLR